MLCQYQLMHFTVPRLQIFHVKMKSELWNTRHTVPFLYDGNFFYH